MWSNIGKVLAAGMVAVVACVIASLGLANRELRGVDQELATVMAKANPTIDNMAAARGELRRLGMRQHAYLAARLAGDPFDRQEIFAVRHRLRQHARTEVGSAAFPDEAPLVQTLDAAVERLDDASDQVLADIDQGAYQQARAEIDHVFDPAVEATDDALHRLLVFNGRHRNERLLAIHRARQRSTHIGFALGLASIVLAALAAAAAWTMLRRLERLVRERNALLQDRAAEMEAFAGRVAHDLRNPLSAIALRLMAAENGDQPPEVRALLARLRERVRHMVAISEGLLDFAQAGHAPTGGRADVEMAVQDVLTDVQPAAAAAQVALRVQPSARGQVACSPGVLSSLLSNLVTNAIKYVGGVERAARWVEIRGQVCEQRLRIEVEDNGPGVPLQAQKRIFQPFCRFDDRQPGIGLGLATVQRLATAHGGATGVRSTPEQGACFWFELPLAGAEPTSVETEARPPLH